MTPPLIVEGILVTPGHAKNLPLCYYYESEIKLLVLMLFIPKIK